MFDLQNKFNKFTHFLDMWFTQVADLKSDGEEKFTQ